MSILDPVRRLFDPNLEKSSQVFVDDKGRTVAPSSFGKDDTTFGVDPDRFTARGYDANELFFGERSKELDYRASFFRCSQHDRKAFEFDGSVRTFPGATPTLAQSNEANYIPLRARRPSAPYRVGRTVVRAFTGMIYGHNRWPQLLSDDPDTQHFAEAVVKAGKLRNRMLRVRDLGGASGVGMVSWQIRNGKPRFRVHAGQFSHVLEWEDPDSHEVCHATELYQSTATRSTDKGPEKYDVWCRRDWTPDADLVFKPVEVIPNETPQKWEVDEKRSFVHGDGFPHCVWVPNFPEDDNPTSTDGQPDYAGLYEQMDTVDILNSCTANGTGLNLDPTLVLKIDQDDVRGAMVKKGSDNALIVGNQGDAKYLTLDKEVVEAGKTIVDMQRGQILESAQCVVPDPDDVAAAGLSSVAVRMIYAPMINAADILREPHGDAIEHLLTQVQKHCQRRMGVGRGAEPEIVEHEEVEEEAPPESSPRVAEPPEEPELQGDPNSPSDPEVFENEELPPDAQEPAVVEYYLDLPPRTIDEPEFDEAGNPTGKTLKRSVPVHPGKGQIRAEWGEYFPPTTDDRGKVVASLSTATGGRRVLSQQSAVETVAGMLNKDAGQEWQRVATEDRQAHEQEMSLTAPAGGQVSTETELPPGATPEDEREQQLDVEDLHDEQQAETPADTADGEPMEARASMVTAEKPDKQEGILGVADIPAIVTVDEARASLGLGPLLLQNGAPDPDGQLTVAEFRAKREAKGEAAGTPPKPPAPPKAPPVSGGNAPPFGGA